MKTLGTGKKIAIGGAGLLALCLGIGACQSATQGDTPTPKVTETVTTPAKIPTKKAEPATETAKLPNLVGEVHQYAQDKAQAAGFYNLAEEDASGEGRMLLWDRNWKVCSQDPAPGTYSVDTTVTLSSVKEYEDCP